MDRTQRRAVGTFTVDMKPAAGEPLGSFDGARVQRFTNRKRFEGDLIADSEGEMLTASSPEPDSAGYVLIERVTGALNGVRGSMALQHSSTVHRGRERQLVVVVPDSGTEGWSGIEGSMTVLIAASGHRFVFDYSLPSGNS